MKTGTNTLRGAFALLLLAATAGGIAGCASRADEASANSAAASAQSAADSAAAAQAAADRAEAAARRVEAMTTTMQQK